MFEGSCLKGSFGKTDRETVYRNCQALCTMGRKTWRHGVSHEQNCVCGDNLAKINMIYHFYAPGQLEYSSIDKMAKYDWSTFLNYVAFLAGELAPWTRHPHHDSESSSCYHDAFLPSGHYHNNIVLFYHDSPLTRSHFMDPTDRAIKGFYCIIVLLVGTKNLRFPQKWQGVIFDPLLSVLGVIVIFSAWITQKAKTHSGLNTAYGDRDLGHHWLR